MAFSTPFPAGRATNNTAFSPNADLTAQITGSGGPVPGSVKPTYAATMARDAVMLYSRFVEIVTTSAVGNATLTTTVGAAPGGRLVVQIDNDAGGARTITFSTGFRATGTVVGTASKAILVEFVSDGLTWNEISRSVSALT